MPALNTLPLDAVPAHTRRRAWANPELTSHSLLVLTFEQLYLAPLAGPPRPETVAAAEGGADLDDVLGSLAVVIDLASVRRLTLDLLTNAIVVEYRGAGLGTSRQRVTFATPEAADACFTKVWRRLGDGCQLAPYRRDTWELARGPLALLVGALLATALLVLTLNLFTDAAPDVAAAHGHMPAWLHLPEWLDWRLVCGVGGVFAAASQVWLYRRLTAPPVSLELSRT